MCTVNVCALSYNVHHMYKMYALSNLTSYMYMYTRTLATIIMYSIIILP